MRTFLLGVLLFAASQADAQNQSRDEQWREDVRYLARTLPASHKNAFAYVTESDFTRAARELEAAVPRLSDDQVRLRIARLVASLRDVHSSAPLPVYSLRMPFTIFWFESGPVIVNATSGHQALVGARITRVNGEDIRVVADTLRPYLSSENELGFWLRAGQLLLRPQALRDVGLGKDTTSTTFDIVSNGASATVTVPGVPAAGFALPARELPLYRQRAGVKYWWTWLPAERTLFVKYNECRDAEDFKRMTDSIAAAIDTQHPQRVVVDLRDNGGGNSSVVKPLIEVLKNRAAVNQPDVLYVVIGRATLSSGLFAAVDLKRNTRATLVGEPTGEHPNHYGEQRVFTLPHSGTEVTYSTKFHVLVEQNADAYTPDVLVLPSPETYVRGVDPAMEWILASHTVPVRGSPLGSQEYYRWSIRASHSNELILTAGDSVDVVLLRDRCGADAGQGLTGCWDESTIQVTPTWTVSRDSVAQLRALKRGAWLFGPGTAGARIYARRAGDARVVARLANGDSAYTSLTVLAPR